MEYNDPMFSGNGILSRTYVRNILSTSSNVFVVCGQPAGLPVPSSSSSSSIDQHKLPHSPSKNRSNSLLNPMATSNNSNISLGPNGWGGSSSPAMNSLGNGDGDNATLVVRAVTLPIWNRLDRRSAWKEYGVGVARFAKEIEEFKPDICFGVDWTGCVAFETLVNTLADNSSGPGLGVCARVPFVFLCFRVFSEMKPTPSDDDVKFYRHRESLSMHMAACTVALSKCDARMLGKIYANWKEIGEPTAGDGFSERSEGASPERKIEVLWPPLRNDIQIEVGRHYSGRSINSYVKPRHRWEKWTGILKPAPSILPESVLDMLSYSARAENGISTSPRVSKLINSPSERDADSDADKYGHSGKDNQIWHHQRVTPYREYTDLPTPGKQQPWSSSTSSTTLHELFSSAIAGNDEAMEGSNSNPVTNDKDRVPTSHSILTPMLNIPSRSSKNYSTKSRNLITCCCRITQEKRVHHFVDMMERIQPTIQRKGLIPCIIGPSIDTVYAQSLFSRMKSMFPGKMSLIIPEFVPSKDLAEIYSKSVVNIHPATTEPYGMSVAEAAAFRCPTLLHHGDSVGVKEMLPSSEYCSFVVDMENVHQSAAVLKSLLEPWPDTPLLSIYGANAHRRSVAWDNTMHANKVQGLICEILEKERQRAKLKRERLLTQKGSEKRHYAGEHREMWCSLSAWIANDVTLLQDSRKRDIELIRDTLVRFLTSPAHDIGAILLNLSKDARFGVSEVSKGINENQLSKIGLFLLEYPESRLGNVRYKLVPSRMKEKVFWDLFIAVLRKQIFDVLAVIVDADTNDSVENLSSPGILSFSLSRGGTPSQVPEKSRNLELDILTKDLLLIVQDRPPAASCPSIDRGMQAVFDSLGNENHILASAEDICQSTKIVILTGFPCNTIEDDATGSASVKKLSMQETDGPPGAVAIAQAIHLQNPDCTIIFPIEESCAGVLESCVDAVFPRFMSDTRGGNPISTVCAMFGDKGQIRIYKFPNGSSPNWTADHDEVIASLSQEADHIVSIERAGPCADGTCRTMRGRVMEWDILAPLHKIVMHSMKDRGKSQRKVHITAIGDGGNEVGMGHPRALDAIHRSVPLGDQIACVVPSDHCIACTVSNWGGYALAAAIACVAARHSSNAGAIISSASGGILSENICRKVLLAANEAGARDGVTKRADCGSVDGYDAETNMDVVRILRDRMQLYSQLISQ